ncbi:MAG: glutamate--cysteine ligase [Thiotrichales bacterium SG8_50]|nr:MAG: glutamate--cysteine ligase [Thiotrichales bacterium SG8_50]
MSIEHLQAVPNLTTAQRGPLQMLEGHLLARQIEIEQWFRSQWLATPPPFYASVDLRNSGFKLAPVDTNLFPAGFNNLNPAFQPLCIQAIQTAVEHFCPKACGILVVPESHTRNIHYLENLATFVHLLELAGFKVNLGSLLVEITSPQTIPLPSGRQITLYPLTRDGNKIKTGGHTPCFVLLNNDLSGGVPDILKDLEQPVMPPVALGWATRRKSQHFAHFQKAAVEFAAIADIDPWFIDPVFRKCGKINFQKREGEDCLTHYVEEVLSEIGAKYREYGVNEVPFVIVKADAGTYGMNIMTVRSPDEVRDLNRKQRTKMARGKEGFNVTEVLVQEGVYTFETWEEAVAEPVVYMIDRFVVGGFYRVHSGRGVDENLNAPGMTFKPLAFAESCVSPDHNRSPDASPNRFYAYGVIARLALVAAAREMPAA